MFASHIILTRVNFYNKTSTRCFSGKLDFRLKGCWFETHLGHCVSFMNKTLYPLLSSDLTQEDKKTSNVYIVLTET